MRRRRLTRFLAGASLVAALASASCGRDGGPAPDRGTDDTTDTPGTAESSGRTGTAAAPASVVLLTLDTTRADHLSPYGGPPDATPNLAALARSGALFERTYAVAPTTLPAHASLFTGLDPIGHGVRHNGVHHLADDAVTLTEVLRGEGFATAAFVSSAVLERRYGLAQGFDHYDDDSSPRRELGRHAERVAGETVDRALAWLDGRSSGGPLLLWVHLYDPHAPYAPPEPFARTWANDPYTGEIAYMDEQIGRLLAHPRLSADTWVVAIGDHGEALGEHGEANHGMLLYDATLYVPWIVSGPGVARGRRIATPAAQIDLPRTLLELLGIADPRARSDQGVSWASALLGVDSTGGPPSAPAGGAEADRGDRVRERILYSETLAPLLSYGWAPLQAVRRGPWKLIAGPAPELYDTGRDPGELANRIDEERAIARELGRELESIAGADPGASPPAPLAAEDAEKLRALGYLTTAHPRRDGELPDPRRMMPVHRLLGEAQEALLAGDAETAVTKLAAVVERDPENVMALETLGTALTRLGRFAEAESTLERALGLDPRRVSLLIAAAGLRAQSGRVEDALALAEHASALDDRSVEARLALARYQAASGRAGAAAQTARAALAMAPSAAAADVVYAELVEQPAGELDAAETRLRRVVAREPLLPEGWLALGRLLEEKGDVDGAEAAYRRGLEEQPEAGQLHAALGRLLVEARPQEAASPLERAAALLHPVPGGVARGLALVAISQRDWLAAERWSRAAIERDESDAAAWTLLAAAHEEQGAPAEALAAYERARQADATYRPALFNRALLLRRQGRYAESAAQLEQLLALDPRHAKGHFELGILLGGPLGDPARARRELELALASGHPEEAAIRRALAELDRPMESGPE